jgi:hypothetical protein
MAMAHPTLLYLLQANSSGCMRRCCWSKLHGPVQAPTTASCGSWRRLQQPFTAQRQKLPARQQMQQRMNPQRCAEHTNGPLIGALKYTAQAAISEKAGGCETSRCTSMQSNLEVHTEASPASCTFPMMRYIFRMQRIAIAAGDVHCACSRWHIACSCLCSYIWGKGLTLLLQHSLLLGPVLLCSCRPFALRYELCSRDIRAVVYQRCSSEWSQTDHRMSIKNAWLRQIWWEEEATQGTKFVYFLYSAQQERILIRDVISIRTRHRSKAELIVRVARQQALSDHK